MTNIPVPEIRNAEEKDLPCLVELLRELFSIEEDFTFDEERQLRGLRLLLEQPHTCIKVLLQDAEILGMASAQIVISTATGGRSAWIEDVVIRKEHRGQGLGSRLLAALEAWCREQGVNRMQLCADKTNRPALDFYRKKQWNPTRMVVLNRHLE